jgi:hypothetical protein
MCRQCARPRARNVRHSGRVRATMRLMSVFLFRIKGPPVTQMTSERCDRDVWTDTFAHECSVNHSWSNLRRVRSAMCGGSMRISRSSLNVLRGRLNTVSAAMYVGMLIILWLLLFAAQPKEFFLDVLKKLEQRSHKCVELRGEYVE